MFGRHVRRAAGHGLDAIRSGARQRFGGALVALATAGTVATLAAAPVGAQPVVVTFNELTALDPSLGINYLDNCYVSSGIRITAVGDPCGMMASLASYSPDDPTGYTGSRAVFSTFQASVQFAPASGSAFSLFGMDLAPFLLGPFDATPISVLFTGNRLAGGTVTQTVMLGTGLTGLTRYNLTGFVNLSSATLTVTTPAYEPYVQFDNISATVLPEPTTVTLLAFGLIGVAAGARRRRTAP